MVDGINVNIKGTMTKNKIDDGPLPKAIINMFNKATNTVM